MKCNLESITAYQEAVSVGCMPVSINVAQCRFLVLWMKRATHVTPGRRSAVAVIAIALLNSRWHLRDTPSGGTWGDLAGRLCLLHDDRGLPRGARLRKIKIERRAEQLSDKAAIDHDREHWTMLGLRASELHCTAQPLWNRWRSPREAHCRLQTSENSYEMKTPPRIDEATRVPSQCDKLCYLLYRECR